MLDQIPNAGILPGELPVIPPLCLLLLTLDPVDERLISPLLSDGGLHVVRVSSLSSRWLAFAQRASGVIVISNDDPLAALVYAVSAGIDRPIIVAAVEECLTPRSDLREAGAFWCLGLPPTAHDVRALTLALRGNPLHNRVDSTCGFVLDPIARAAQLGRRAVRLGQREFAILDCLSRHGGTPVAAEALMRYVWGDRVDGRVRRALDVHVCHLRRKLSELGLEQVITTARGFGYMLGRAPLGDAAPRVSRPGFSTTVRLA